MSVPCFTRPERNGVSLILPLGGPRRLNPLLVNATVFAVYEQVAQGRPVAELAEWYCQSLGALDAPADQIAGDRMPDREKVILDLFRILAQFRDHGIGGMLGDELLGLLPPGHVVPGVTQLMPICAAEETASFFRRALDDTAGVSLLFSTPGRSCMTPALFDRYQVVRRHLAVQQVHFILADERCRIVSATAVEGYGLGDTIRVRLVAGSGRDRDDWRRTVTRHLSGLIELLGAVTLSPLLRFQMPEFADGAFASADLAAILAELEFRRSFYLRDEFDAGCGLLGYDRVLGAKS